jgi:hypothetical protein
MIPDRSVPMNIKGTPSNRMLKNEIEKSCKLNVNQLITIMLNWEPDRCYPGTKTANETTIFARRRG